MVKPKQITILKGAKVVRVGSDSEIKSEKDFRVDLVQYKCGYAYYTVKDALFRTSQWNVKEWREENDLATV